MWGREEGRRPVSGPVSGVPGCGVVLGVACLAFRVRDVIETGRGVVSFGAGNYYSVSSCTLVHHVTPTAMRPMPTPVTSVNHHRCVCGGGGKGQCAVLERGRGCVCACIYVCAEGGGSRQHPPTRARREIRQDRHRDRVRERDERGESGMQSLHTFVSRLR